MKDRLSTIQISKGEPLYRQIERHMRNLLLSGEYPPDTKLPPTQELAAMWNTQTLTIHTALTPLVKEGLLTRRPRLGTFVRKREKKLTCVAIYGTAGTLHGSLFEQALQSTLKEELTADGIEVDFWLDPRTPLEQCGPWTPLVQAAEQRKFQALIAISADAWRLPWQTRLPVPTAFQTAVNHPNAVSFDVAQLAELSVQTLAQQGCRSVGLISTVPADFIYLDGSRYLFAEFYERLQDRVSALVGLTMKKEWMCVPPAQANVGGGVGQEQFGHEEFLRLWAQPQRPEGLIVYPDTAAQGVIMGLLEKQVRVPEELKLVLHKNQAVDLYCPVPASFVVSSERAIARALIEQVQKQFRGERCEPVRISFDMASN